jgi:hypothetical protein
MNQLLLEERSLAGASRERSFNWSDYRNAIVTVCHQAAARV